MKLDTCLRYLIAIKVCVTRSIGWIGVFNSGMILFIFLSRLQEKGIFTDVPLKSMFILVYLGTMLFLLLFGIVDRKLLHAKEIEYKFIVSPHWQQILKDLREIKDWIKKEELK